MAASKASARVVIVGAGPVGMVCALALNRSGISVTVFEQEPEPPIEQRAATIHPSTLEMLDDLGVTKKVIPLGLISNAYRFHDRVSNDVVAEFNLDLMRDEFRFPFALQYEQYKMTASIAAEYANAGDFDVRFSHSVTGLTQGADDVEIEIDTPDGPARMRADYVIGCDGGRSSVRKGADIGFEGFTYPERFIKIATPFDVATLNRNLVLRNYFSDPFEWCNLFKVRGEEPGGLWRAIFPTAGGRGRGDRAAAGAGRGAPAEILSEARATMKPATSTSMACTSAWPRPSARPRAARRRLRALNNPIGGMGMNGGIHDGHQPRREARPRHPRRGRRRTARSLQPPAPPRRGEIRPGADHRQQAADGGARPRGATRRTSTSCGGRPKIRKPPRPICAAPRCSTACATPPR